MNRQPSEKMAQARTDAVEAVKVLAWLEGWSDAYLERVVCQIAKSPASDVLPTMHHYQDQIVAFTTDQPAEGSQQT